MRDLRLICAKPDVHLGYIEREWGHTEGKILCETDEVGVIDSWTCLRVKKWRR